MKNEKIGIGDRVITIENREIRRGLVKRIFDEDIPYPIIIVEFDDGEIKKCFLDKIVLESEIKNAAEEEEKPINEPIEKSEVTIAPAEFKKMVGEIIAKESENNSYLDWVFCKFASKIHKALFL